MMKNSTMPKITVLLGVFALLFSVNAFAQPANDDCANAFALTIGADLTECTEVEGNTVGGTGSSAPATVCSGSWFQDDIWFSLTTPATVPAGALIIKANFGSQGTDVPAVGMAIYPGCGTADLPLACFSSNDPADDEIKIFTGNLNPNQDYYVRVWSGGSPTDNSGTVRVCTYWEPASEDVVLWGDQAGQGDFANGFTDWTVQAVNVDSALWNFSPTSSSSGCFRGTTISSPTSFNGAAVFNADSINTPDCNNPPPGPPYPVLTGELISPTIDLSAADAVSLKFFQAYSPLNGDAFFAYSTDDGNTWSPNIEVSSEIAGNGTAPIPSEQRFFLPDLANQSQVRIKFIFDGDYYYWIIDDVQLIQPENNNLVVQSNFFAIAPNAQWPISQVEEFAFLADIANIGAAPQPNTTLTISIEDEQGMEVFTDALNYGLTAADSLYENAPMLGTFTPSAAGIYTGTYSIASDSVDFDLTNNFQSFSFTVTDDTVFAKEQGITRTVLPAEANWDEMEPHSWAYGNTFFVVNGTDAAEPDNRWVANAISFGIGNAADIPGRLLTLKLYKWAEDANNNGEMDPDERGNPVGQAFYEILGTESDAEFITVPLTPFPSGEEGQVPLESGFNYAAMVEYQVSDEVDFVILGAEPWDYAAQTFRSNPLNFPDEPEAHLEYRPAELLGIGGDLSAEGYSAAGFTGTVVPAVRLHMAKYVEPDAIQELDPANIVTVSPNPASDYINLNVDLVNMQDEVQVRIMDATGKLVLETVYNNVTKETFQFNVNNFAVGTYMLNFVTEEGLRTERFIIQR